MSRSTKWQWAARNAKPKRTFNKYAAMPGETPHHVVEKRRQANKAARLARRITRAGV